MSGPVEVWLNSVLSRIADGTLLPSAYFRPLDCKLYGRPALLLPCERTGDVEVWV